MARVTSRAKKTVVLPGKNLTICQRPCCHSCRLRGYIRSFQGVRTSEPSFRTFCWHSGTIPGGFLVGLQCGRNSLRTVKTRCQSRSTDTISTMFGLLHLFAAEGLGIRNFFGGLGSQVSMTCLEKWIVTAH